MLLVDSSLRPWPDGPLSRLEARCGARMRYGLALAALLSLVAFGLGLPRRRRWCRWLSGRGLSAGRWRGEAREIEQGWVLITDEGSVCPLDLSDARVLGEGPVAGACCVVATPAGGGNPYRLSVTLRVHRMACGDESRIAAQIRREQDRVWGLTLATVAPLVVPVLLCAIAAYWDLTG